MQSTDLSDGRLPRGALVRPGAGVRDAAPVERRDRVDDPFRTSVADVISSERQDIEAGVRERRRVALVANEPHAGVAPQVVVAGERRLERRDREIGAAHEVSYLRECRSRVAAVLELDTFLDAAAEDDLSRGKEGPGSPSWFDRARAADPKRVTTRVERRVPEVAALEGERLHARLDHLRREKGDLSALADARDWIGGTDHRGARKCSADRFGELQGRDYGGELVPRDVIEWRREACNWNEWPRQRPFDIRQRARGGSGRGHPREEHHREDDPDHRPGDHASHRKDARGTGIGTYSDAESAFRTANNSPRVRAHPVTDDGVSAIAGSRARLSIRATMRRVSASIAA